MEIGVLFATSATTPEHIALAERLGYSHAFVYDSPTFLADAWMVLALAAERTSRITLGPCVITPRMRHLVANAGAAATLNTLAPGRVTIVIGSGFTTQIMINERPMPWRQVEAYLVGMRGLLAGEEIEWEGGIIGLRHGELSGITLPADIPLWVAAHGPKGYEIGQRIADGIVTNPGHGSRNEGPNDLGRIAVQFFGTVLDDGEDPGSERVLQAAGPAAAFQLHIGGEGLVGGSPEWSDFHHRIEAIEERRRHLEVHGGHLIEVSDLERPLITADLIRRTTATGPPEEVAARVQQIAGQGTGGLLYGPQGPDIERELSLFADAVGLTSVLR